MATSSDQRPPRDYQVWSKSRDVLAHTNDQSTPGRPLLLLLGGALVALVAFGLIALTVYRTWVRHEIGEDQAFTAIGLLFAIHTFGVFLFAYGYELYDMAKALRLTLIVAFLSVVAIFIVITALALLSRSKDAGRLALGVMSGDEDDGRAFISLGSLGGRSRPEDPDPTTPQPFAIRCGSCNASFEPAPPRAICPFCGRVNLAGA